MSLRHGAVQRVLRCDEEAQTTFSKKAVETLNVAACEFVRTLAKAAAVTAGRAGHKRVERSHLEEVIQKHIRLSFLIGCLPEKEGIAMEESID